MSFRPLRLGFALEPQPSQDLVHELAWHRLALLTTGLLDGCAAVTAAHRDIAVEDGVDTINERPKIKQRGNRGHTTLICKTKRAQGAGKMFAGGRGALSAARRSRAALSHHRVARYEVVYVHVR